MAKGFLSALKGVDAFGKVSNSRDIRRCGGAYVLIARTDYGGCEGQDTHRGALYVLLPPSPTDSLCLID